MERLISELKQIDGVKIPENIMELLKEDRDIKEEIKEEVKEKKLVKPSCPLPYFPNLEYTGCKALRVNHKLYTPCGQDILCGEYCKTCINSGLKLGTLEDRKNCMPSDFIALNGDKPIQYGNVMEKLYITREEAEREAAKWGQIIPEEYFKVIKKKRGRKKKVEKIVVSDEELNIENDEIRGELFKTKDGNIILKGYDGKYYNLLNGAEIT